MRSLCHELDRLFGEFWPWDEGDGEVFSAVWAPRTDFSETETAYLVKMDLPGIEKKEISVDLEDNRLVVWGERKEEETEEDDRDFRRNWRATYL